MKLSTNKLNMAEKLTLCLIKPDGVSRSLMGDVLTVLQRRGFLLMQCRMVDVDEELATKHYLEHKDTNPYFPEMIKMLTAGPVWAMVLQSPKEERHPACEVLRKMMGHFDPHRAEPGTIRAQFGNIIHGSDSVESVEREIGLWFPDYKI